MIKVTPVMSNLLSKALADGTPCLIGRVSKHDHPQFCSEGSAAVYDDQTLCYWERSHRTSQARIGENPHVMVHYCNTARAKENPYGTSCIRFYGKARIVTSGPERDRAWELTNYGEQSKDPEKKAAAMPIDLHLIEEIDSKVIMKRD